MLTNFHEESSNTPKLVKLYRFIFVEAYLSMFVSLKPALTDQKITRRELSKKYMIGVEH